MQSCGVLFDVKQKDHHDKSACQPAQQGSSPQDILYAPLDSPPSKKVCMCVRMCMEHICVYVCACMVMRPYHEWCCFPLLSISCILSLPVFLCSARNDRQCPALCTPWKDTVSSSVQLQHICSIKRLKYRRLISLWMNRHLRERLSS